MPNIVPSAPTRFPNGVNNSAMPGGHPGTTYQMGHLDPTKFQTYMEDFNLYASTSFVATLVGTGTQTIAANTAGGILNVANTAGATDSTFFQLANATFLPVTNKRLFFKGSVNASSATLPTLLIGLTAQGTTLAGVTQGIFFQKAAGSANIDVYVELNATTGRNSITNVGQFTAGSQFTFGFHYDGKQSVEFFLNDIKVATVGTIGFLPTVALAPTLYVGNSSAVITSAAVDYLFASEER